MKKCLLVLTLCVLLTGVGLAQDLSGALSGALGPGSFNVIDSIWVAAAQTLTLAPGTTFNFAGAFGFGVAGTLTAVGTEADSIKFVPATGVPFWKGIDFITASGTSSVVQYCLISGANTSGIYIDHAGPAISHCTFINNGSQEMGGGIYSMYGTGSISDCFFANNTALHGGGAVIRYTPVNVSNCVFTGNSGTYGGAMAYYFSTVCNLTNCLFYGNSANAGGGIRFSTAPVNVINCTFAGNSSASGSGVYYINAGPTINDCILWANTGSAQIVKVGSYIISVTYTDVQDTLWPGTGNISSDPLYVTGPDGAYYLSQIAAGQGADSPCMDAGDPASAMITGTTRTDQVQDAGVVDMGYHYSAAGAPPPLVTITLLPVNPPIIIPATGGPFDWDITLHNNATTPLTIDIWNVISGPATRPGWGPYMDLTMPAGATINRIRTQYVSDRFPPGAYTYTSNIGDYPDSVWDSDSFPYTKTAVGADGWAIGQSTTATPTEYALHGATPNPFNPTTTLSYALPQAGRVKLMVYNVAGREVATLVNGWRDAGIHEVTFDASGMPSGVYLAQLTAANFSAVKAMMLLK